MPGKRTRRRETSRIMMPLVDYSDSDDSVGHGEKGSPADPQSTKRKRLADSTLPPLPNTFHDLYASTTRVSSSDDPSLHSGRQRQIPHVEGNWPSHVYVEWFPSTEESKRLQGLIARFSIGNDGLHSLLRSDLGAELPLHISLSRPIVLQADQRQVFVKSLTSKINASGVPPFSLLTSSLAFHPNYEKTRWFLVLRLENDPKGSLLQLLNASNAAAAGFGQPPLYAMPAEEARGLKRLRRSDIDVEKAHNVALKVEDAASAFHISIGWMLEAPAKEVQDVLKDLDPTEQGAFEIRVANVKVKMGNNVSVIALSEKRDVKNGIIE